MLSRAAYAPIRSAGSSLPARATLNIEDLLLGIGFRVPFVSDSFHNYVAHIVNRHLQSSGLSGSVKKASIPIANRPLMRGLLIQTGSGVQGTANPNDIHRAV